MSTPHSLRDVREPWQSKRKEQRPHLTRLIAIVPVVTVLAGGIIVIMSNQGTRGLPHPVELAGIALLWVASLAAAVFAWLSSNRLNDNVARLERVQQELRESEQKYRGLVENAPVGIVVSSFDGRVIEVNDTLTRMHGYETKEEFAQSSVADRFCDLRDRERWVAMVWSFVI